MWRNSFGRMSGHAWPEIRPVRGETTALSKVPRTNEDSQNAVSQQPSDICLLERRQDQPLNESKEDANAQCGKPPRPHINGGLTLPMTSTSRNHNQNNLQADHKTRSPDK